MLNGPALLRVFLVVIAAAVLTGIVQHYWIFDSNPQDAPETSVRPATQTAPVRQIDPAPARAQPAPVTAPRPAPTAQSASPAPSAPDPAPVAPPESRSAAVLPIASQGAADPAHGRAPPQAVPAQPPAAVGDQAETGAQEVAAAEATDGRAVDLVDLNSGSLSELNGLKGGGAIGRAIIQRRPYTSIDQLLSKRVLSRAIYQRIKDQVTVR